MGSSTLGKFLKVSFLIGIVSCTGATLPAHAQNKADWNNRKAAVSLTYDDALAAQLENAVPLLDSLGLKATFYLSGYFEGFRNHTGAWGSVAEAGHELGNHTLYHPCQGGPGREWVQPDYDLRSYTVKRMADEIRMTNTLLSLLDDRPASARTLAYPCGDTEAGDSSYVRAIKDNLVAARGVRDGIEQIGNIDLFNIDSYLISGQSGEELIELVQKAMDEHGLVVFLFHGVGGGHNLNVSLEAHRKLLHFLKEHEQELWIAPLIDIAEHVKNHHR
ncbi:polysaccharide deacetylase family protein [Halalkalibaculum sp. DA3122]|uniref:polysaccharide deacetylase family protein n=1 Tax=Halalkalibaculum sp. DA3122 TaxID=3373607 RepID=UPI003754E17E